MNINDTKAQLKNHSQKISDTWVFDLYQLYNHTNASAKRDSCSIIKQVVKESPANELEM